MGMGKDCLMWSSSGDGDVMIGFGKAGCWCTLTLILNITGITAVL
jgi:hypothetical protein